MLFGKISPKTFEYHNNCLILVIKANKRIKYIFDNSNDLNKHENENDIMREIIAISEDCGDKKSSKIPKSLKNSVIKN